MNEPIQVVGPKTSIKLKNKSCLLEFLIIATTTLLGVILGVMAAPFLLSNYLPPWHHAVIKHPFEEIRDILFIKYYHSLIDDTWADTVIVSTESSEIYSLHQNQWQVIKPPPQAGEELHFSLSRDSAILAVVDNDKIFQLNEGIWEWQQNITELPRRLEEFSCNEWDRRPPINTKRAVIDSDGVIEEHALADYSRCYVLLDDGSLHVWTREVNIYSVWLVLGGSTIVGIIIGFLAGAVVIRRSSLFKRKVVAIENGT